MRLPTSVAVLTCAALTACAPPQPPTSRIDRVQMGDNSLSCGQLRAQVADMDAVVRRSNAGASSSTGQIGSNGAVGYGAGMAGGFAGVPVIGSAVGIFTGGQQNQASSAAMQAEQDADDAKARKEHLVDIANQRGCYGR